MKVYTIGHIYSPDCKLLDIFIDARLSAGLLEKLEAVEGVTYVYEEDRLSDTFFSVHISRRTDEEDIRIIRRDLDDVCDKHITE